MYTPHIQFFKYFFICDENVPSNSQGPFNVNSNIYKKPPLEIGVKAGQETPKTLHIIVIAVLDFFQVIEGNPLFLKTSRAPDEWT